MPPTRYLLYDAAESEGPSKQRMAGLYFLRRAMELDRVLVLPRCRLLARHRQRTRNHAAAIRLKGDDVYVPFSSLYNVSALATLHPVVELRDYLRTSPVIEKFAWRPPCNASNDDRRSVRFNGRLVRVRATQPCSWFDELPRLAQDTSVSMAFGNSRDELQPHLAAPLRPFWRLRDAVYEAAASFVRARFGDGPWLAVHWRRGDFVGLRPSKYVHGAVRVLKHVRKLANTHGAGEHTRVYLATDGDDGPELRQLTAALSVVRATEDVVMNVSILTGDGTTTARAGGAVRRRALRAALHAHLELAICSMAPWFLGSATSTFTATILDERVSVFGHDRGTAAHMIGDDAVGFARSPPAAARWRPLPLPERPPDLRIRVPTTWAELDKLRRRGRGRGRG
jgi:hypothetical protein